MVKTKSRTRKQLKYMGGMIGGSGNDNLNLENLTINEDEQEICTLCNQNIDSAGVPRIERCIVCYKRFHRRCLARYCEVIVDNGDKGTDPELISVPCPYCRAVDGYWSRPGGLRSRRLTCKELLNDTRSSTTGTNTTATSEGAVMMDPDEVHTELYDSHLIEHNDTEVSTNNVAIVGDDSSSDGDGSGNDEGVEESKFMEPPSTSSEEDPRDSDKDIEDFMKSVGESYGVEQPITRSNRIIEDEFITKINELGLNKERAIQKFNELMDQQEQSNEHKESWPEDRRIINEDLKEGFDLPRDIIIVFNNPPDSDDTTLFDRSLFAFKLYKNYKNAHPKELPDP